MLDRAYSFAEQDLAATLRDETIPVALDVHYAVRRRDASGAFLRRVVYQRPELERGHTQQGFYLCAADGTLYEGWNNRSVRRLRQRLADGLAAHRARGEVTHAVQPDPAIDKKYTRALPDGGAVVEVFSRVLDGTWTKPPTELGALRRAATGRDHLWIARGELNALAEGVWPDRLGRRIARFHLIDNTRGEPPMWTARERRACQFAITRAANGDVDVTGRVALVAKGGHRGYEAALRGAVVMRGAALQRFDLVSCGDHWGHGPFVRDAPAGRFRLAVAFRLAERDYAARIPPQAARDRRRYLAAR